MPFKTFRGESEREVLSMAKADLGDDIMILDLHRVHTPAGSRGPNKPVILKVGTDPRTGERPHVQAELPRTGPQSPGRASETVYGRATHPDQAQTAELFQLRQQLRSLKAHLRVVRTSPFLEPFDQLFIMLTEAGAPDQVAERLVQHTEEQLVGMDGGGQVSRSQALNVLRQQISQLFLPEPKTSRSRRQEVVVVVGPSGAGKTSLIVKLASHQAVYGRRRVGIISTDIFRAGANAGLKSMGKILSVPIIEVRQVEDLPRALTNLKNCDIIMVDSPGRSPLSRGSLPDLQTQLAVLQPNETLLVLSANMALEELWLFSGLYQGLHPTGLVMTKLDETSRPGKILGLIDDAYPPLRYVSTGQSVPQSLALDVARAVMERLPLDSMGH